MSEQQVMEIRFRGERLGSYTDEIGTTWTLYRGTDGYYRIHASDRDGAWMEAGRYGNGLQAWQVLRDWPAFSAL